MNDPSARDAVPSEALSALRRRQLACGLAIAVVIAFAPFATCGFVFDDVDFIVGNRTITSGDVFGALFGRHQLMGNRPLTHALLAAQWSVFGGSATGFRWVSLLLHLLATRLLFAVVHAVLQGPALRTKFSAAGAWGTAFAVTALWSLHPLTVDSVAYVTQQSMLLMAVFLLAAMRCLQLVHAAPERRGIAALAIACVALGMTSKEESAPAPLLLVLFDRAFLAASWREVADRKRLHLCFAATWLVLGYCIASGVEITSAGWHTAANVGSREWLMTQAGVVCRYFLAACWPTGLRGIYDWPIVRDFGDAAVPGAIVLAMFVATVWLFRRRPATAYPLAAAFLLLASTSSVLPLYTEPVAERRMYLPMLAVVVPAVLVLRAFGRRLLPSHFAWLPIAGLAVAAIVATRFRVAAYTDEQTFWADALQHRDPRNRGYTAAILLDNKGRLLRQQGDLEGARAAFAEAAECDDAPSTVRLHLLAALLELGRKDEAAPILKRLAADEPQLAGDQERRALRSLESYRKQPAAARQGANDPWLADAAMLAETAAMLQPGKVSPQNTLGMVQFAQGNLALAEATFRRAIAIDPDYVAAWSNLGELLARSNRVADADVMWRQFLERRPNDIDMRLKLGASYLRAGQLEFAKAMYEDVMRLQPDHAGARNALDQIERQRRK